MRLDLLAQSQSSSVDQVLAANLDKKILTMSLNWNMHVVFYGCYCIRACVLILDDLSLMPHPSLLAELLSILEYRGEGHSLWINEVLSSDECEVVYPEGLYYMTEECYVITTWTTGW